MFSWIFGGSQDPSPEPDTEPAPELDRTESIPAKPIISPEDSATGDLHRYAEDSQQYVPLIKDAVICIEDDEENAFSRTFSVFDSKGNLQFSQPLDHGMQINFSAKEHSMVWLLPIGDELDGEIVSLRFVFNDPVVEDRFKYDIAQKLYEVSRKESFKKTVKPQDQEWVLRSNAHVNEDEEPEDPMEISSSGETDAESDDDTPPSTPVRNRGKSAVDKNSHLAMGMNTDRMFVVRGSDIGVFKHGRGDIKHVGTLDNVRASDGTIFSPAKVMLHDREKKMLMLRPDQQNKVVELDLETRQIVQEYQAEDDFVIRDLGPHSRFSQMEGTELITGLNKNSVFTMDPRLHSKNKKVNGFSYAANPHLSCIAANGKAQYVLGSDKGEIRMFSDLGKRAKTLLPGLGHAVTGIDTSADGKWVLATTDRYILLIPTELENGRTGFDVSMGKKKPDPIKLQMKAEDVVKYKIREVRFRKATFDLGPNKKEEFIVSAIGNLLLTWKLKGVLRGRTMDYTVKVYDENVVADQFRYGYKDVVVTLPDEIKRARFTAN